MKYLLSVFLCLYGYLSFSQSLEFVKEKLDFEITETEFTVDGIYYFKNTSPDTIKQYMLYPFPENPELGQVTSVIGFFGLS